MDTQKLYSEYYIKEYVNSNQNKSTEIRTSDGILVKFYATENIHAFTRSKSFSNTKIERTFDYDRARKLSYIKQVIMETCKEEILKKDFFNKEKNFWERHYFVPSKKYYIYLIKDKKGNFVFKSHYSLKTHKDFLKKWKFFGQK
ncbi:MAG: hypothetical protein M1479_03075 [Actinobacteria bacterium]|nr:hypothetical protein [Actinomycetota bacterium]